MLQIAFVGLSLLFSLSFASEHQRIDTLGVSKKGQFVALEEYGYVPTRHSYYVTIKIMNVWKKEYVGSSIQVEVPAKKRQQLDQARQRAKELARTELEKFNISG